MARSQFLRCFVLALALALIGTPIVRSDDPGGPVVRQAGAESSQTVKSLAIETNRPQPKQTAPSIDKNGMAWTIYALRDFGQGASQGKWLAETIVQVVQPQSWSSKIGPTATVVYDPQGKVLVVYNTPAVQEEVRAFLNAMPASDRTCNVDPGATFRLVPRPD